MPAAAGRHRGRGGSLRDGGERSRRQQQDWHNLRTADIVSDAPTPLRRPRPRLTFDDAIEVRKRHFLGESQHHIAQTFGVSHRPINDILK